MSMQERVNEKLTTLEPVVLDVINESSMHSVPKDAETHFKVVIVSPQFDGKSLVQRHRMVNALLSEELAQGIHALSIQAFTAAEWRDRGGEVADSPDCLGGSKAG